MKKVLGCPVEFGKTVLKFKKIEREIHAAHDVKEGEKEW